MARFESGRTSEEEVEESFEFRALAGDPDGVSEDEDSDDAGSDTEGLPDFFCFVNGIGDDDFSEGGLNECGGVRRERGFGETVRGREGMGKVG